MNCLSFIIRKAFFAHLLVPFWKDRRERRLLRNRVMAELCESYVSDLPVIIPQDATPRRMPREYVFSIWLQGED